MATETKRYATKGDLDFLEGKFEAAVIQNERFWQGQDQVNQAVTGALREIHRRLDSIDTRIAGIHRRLDGIDTGLASVDGRLDDLTDLVRKMAKKMGV